jgi:hypothetical protein
MLTGVAGALMPRRGDGWLRRLVLNSGAQRKDVANDRAVHRGMKSSSGRHEMFVMWRPRR